VETRVGPMISLVKPWAATEEGGAESAAWVPPEFPPTMGFLGPRPYPANKL